MVLVQPAGGHVWLGAAGARTAGLGLFRVERSSAKGQRLVHAQIADVLAGGRGSAAAALVDTGGGAARGVPCGGWHGASAANSASPRGGAVPYPVSRALTPIAR